MILYSNDFNKLANAAQDAAFLALNDYKKKNGGFDGGTCNFDKVAIPGGKRTLALVEASCLRGYLRTSGMWKGYVLVAAPDCYQGAFNTVQVEAMATAFKSGGFPNTTVYYQMD
jgi:hypothetical protein